MDTAQKKKPNEIILDRFAIAFGPMRNIIIIIRCNTNVSNAILVFTSIARHKSKSGASNHEVLL